jgi:hypothetical protein
MEQTLPGLGAVRKPEQGLVVPSPQAIRAALLVLGDTDRKVPAPPDRLIGDRALAHGRADYLVPATFERLEEPIE